MAYSQLLATIVAARWKTGYPVEIFFVQLGMEGNDGGNGCFYLPTFLHIEQTTKLEQEIFFVGGEGNKVVFLQMRTVSPTLASGSRVSSAGCGLKDESIACTL